ncbi:hypothetical protein H9P43_008688 [Blastocladiella emersonii ATCC 22665]|nr:hypothetical protein H9P43_008688 [Blastocladiella emersonii ATCC 22665]
MDARFLTSFGTSIVAFYATKYSTKARDIIENHAAIIAAYKARHPRFASEPDAFSRGHKKLLSLAYHMSANCMEVPETMAALFLHTSAAGIFSHKFAPLLLYQGIKWVELAGIAAGEATNEDVKCIASLINVDGKPMLNVALHDYIFRPAELERLSWYDFVRTWSRVAMPKKMRQVLTDGGRVEPAQPDLEPDAEIPPGTKLCFMADHPLAKTFELRKKVVEAVPKIDGPHLPDPRKFADVAGSEEKYCRMALLLLQHFRFKAFKETLEPGHPALDHLEYAQKYYFSLDGAREFRELRDRENAELAAQLSLEEKGELYVPDRDGETSSRNQPTTDDGSVDASWTTFGQSENDIVLDPTIVNSDVEGILADYGETEANLERIESVTSTLIPGMGHGMMGTLLFPDVQPFDVNAAPPPPYLETPISPTDVKKIMAQLCAAAAQGHPTADIKGNITRPRDRRRTRERVAICDKDVFRLGGEPETTTELPAILELFVGMEMRVKTNQCVAKGCANGAVGVVHHIDWKPDTTFTRTASNMYRPSCAPLNVWNRPARRSSWPSLPGHAGRVA